MVRGEVPVWRGIKHVWRRDQPEKKKRIYMPRKKTGLEPGYRTGRPRVHSPETTAQVREHLASGMTVRAVSERMGLPKSTVHRMRTMPPVGGG